MDGQETTEAGNTVDTTVSDNVASTELDLSGLPDAAKPPETPGDMSAFVPAEYKDKEWVQNILRSENPQSEFFNQFEHARSLVGKRPLQKPGDDATPEQWQAFYKELGVPETVEGYQVPEMQWSEQDKELGAAVEGTINKDLVARMAAAAREAGVLPHQFQQLYKNYLESTAEVSRETYQQYLDTERSLDETYEQAMTKQYGAQAPQVLEIGRKLLNESVEPNTRQFINELANTEDGTKALTVLAGAMYGFYKKHVGEDTMPGAGTPAGNATGNTIEDLSNQAKALMQTEAYRDHRHPDSHKVREQVDAIYAQMGREYKMQGAR